MPWTTQSADRIAWQKVDPQRASDDPFGLDFEFQFRAEYPMIFSADRPLYFVSSLSEGQP